MNSKCTILLFVLFLSGTVSAGTVTVTLTGSCPENLLPNSILPFTLSNSGNGSATNLLITAHAIGIASPNATFSIVNLWPDQSNTIYVMVSNSIRGTYVYYFLTAYQEGSSTFTAVFPCLVSINGSTASLVRIVNTSVTRKSQTESVVNAEVENLGGYDTTINVAIILPPSFTVVNMSRTVNLAANDSKAFLSFPVMYQGSMANYSGIVVVSYQKQGSGYASLSTFAIDLYPTSSAFGPTQLVLLAIAVIIVILILLIARAVLKARTGKKGEPPSVAQQAEARAGPKKENPI